MRVKNWCAGFGLLALGLLSAGARPALADSLRCGRKLVSDGDTLYDVRTRCGDPDNQIHRVETRTVSQWVQGPCVAPGRCGQMVQRTIEVTIDEWTYDFGPHQFISYVTFEDGRLISIVSGARGTKGKS